MPLGLVLTLVGTGYSPDYDGTATIHHTVTGALVQFNRKANDALGRLQLPADRDYDDASYPLIEEQAVDRFLRIRRLDPHGHRAVYQALYRPSPTTGWFVRPPRLGRHQGDAEPPQLPDVAPPDPVRTTQGPTRRASGIRAAILLHERRRPPIGWERERGAVEPKVVGGCAVGGALWGILAACLGISATLWIMGSILLTALITPPLQRLFGVPPVTMAIPPAALREVRKMRAEAHITATVLRHGEKVLVREINQPFNGETSVVTFTVPAVSGSMSKHDQIELQLTTHVLSWTETRPEPTGSDPVPWTGKHQHPDRPL